MFLNSFCSFNKIPREEMVVQVFVLLAAYSCVTTTSGLTCQADRNCDVCGKPNKYGTDCSLPCPENCESGCHRTDGHCDHQCKEGYFGRFCNNTCPDYCRKGCQQTSAQCFGGCEAGWRGLHCTELCPNGCLSVCTQLSGQCLPTGRSAKETCKMGLYGPRCTQLCPQNCDGGCDNNGVCDHQCKPGYHGKTCNKPCSVHCSEGCNQTTAHCFGSCEPGRYGNKCENLCPSDCVNRVCYRDSGLCTKGTTAVTTSSTGMFDSNVYIIVMFSFTLVFNMYYDIHDWNS